MRSTIVGMSIAVVLGLLGSQVMAQTSTPTQTALHVIATLSDITSLASDIPALQSRIGSLAVDSGISFASYGSNCITADSTTGGLDSCLFAGPTTLSNIIVEKAAYFLGDVSVGGVGGLNSTARFVVEGSNLALGQGMMVSSLGYSSSNPEDATLNPTPRDLTTQSEVCATANGTMIRCAGSTGSTVSTIDPGATVTYAWDIGSYGACTSGGGICSGSWDITTSGQSTSGQCTVEWENDGCDDIGGGQWGNCNSANGDFTQTVSDLAECLDLAENQCGNDADFMSNNGIDDAGCQVTRTTPSSYEYDEFNFVEFVPDSSTGTSTTTTYQCSGPINSSACTSQNAACTWNPSDGTQTRPVVCKDSNGVTVADSFCPSPKPATSQACSSGTGLVTGTGSTPTAVPGASVWYCHLGQFNEQSGTTCDNENFPAGYMWEQTRVCTTGTPTDAMCESGPGTAPSTANCTYSGSAGFWNCTD